MRILIIRHGDPDYSIDGLTEKGKREVKYLTERLLKDKLDHVYCSIYGRAKLTIKPYLDKTGKDCTYYDWLKEFGSYPVRLPYLDGDDGCWDIMPEYMNTLTDIYHPTKWREEEFIKNSKVAEGYDYVTKNLDELLLKHGYRREGYNYKVEKPNHDTVVLVCHFGLTAVILSHLLNCSPYSIWQHTFTAPTSVTTLYTEERHDGIASMRASAIGDVSHLMQNGETPSFSGRFAECFSDSERH